jgi:hypothetical protein
MYIQLEPCPRCSHMYEKHTRYKCQFEQYTKVNIRKSVVARARKSNEIYYSIAPSSYRLPFNREKFPLRNSPDAFLYIINTQLYNY